MELSLTILTLEEKIESPSSLSQPIIRAKESTLIWKQGTGAGSTGSVLVKLAQNGYTREAHQVIELSRIASLIGRDSDGGLPELWDVMGQTRGINGITRLMAVSFIRSKESFSRAKALIVDHIVDPMEKDDFGRTALHHSLGMRHPKDKITSLDSFEFSMNQSINTDLTRFLIQTSPKALSIKVLGKTPLHFALEKGKDFPIDILKLMIETYPEALQEKDYDEMLPCHIACSRSLSLDIISLIVTTDPLALQERDIHGKLPLHWACSSNASYDVVKLLVDSYPNSVKEKIDRGRLPLHLACMHLSPFEVIKLLVESYEDAVKENKNFEGKLPLHDAYKAPYEVYNCLLEKFPDARLIADNSGRLPSAYLTPTSPAWAHFC